MLNLQNNVLCDANSAPVMPAPDLSDKEETLLRAIREEGIVDLYDLAQGIGTGPRAVQEAVRYLVQHDLVHASGRRIRCTKRGEQWVYDHQ